MKSFPAYVFHLLGEPAVRSVREEGAEAYDDSAESHDEHHVEASQGVQRQESAVG